MSQGLKLLKPAHNVPLLVALCSLLDGIQGILEGSWGGGAGIGTNRGFINMVSNELLIREESYRDCIGS